MKFCSTSTYNEFKNLKISLGILSWGWIANFRTYDYKFFPLQDFEISPDIFWDPRVPYFSTPKFGNFNLGILISRIRDFVIFRDFITEILGKFFEYLGDFF